MHECMYECVRYYPTLHTDTHRDKRARANHILMYAVCTSTSFTKHRDSKENERRKTHNDDDDRVDVLVMVHDEDNVLNG